MLPYAPTYSDHRSRVPPSLASLTLSSDDATHYRRSVRHCLIRVQLAIELLAVKNSRRSSCT